MPSVPPVAVNTVPLPEHTVVVPLMPLGAVDAVFTVTVVVAPPTGLPHGAAPVIDTQ